MNFIINNIKKKFAQKSFEDGAESWVSTLTNVNQGKRVLTDAEHINLRKFIDNMIKFNHKEWYSAFYALLPESNTTTSIADKAYFWNKIIEKSLEYNLERNCQMLPSGKKEYSTEKFFYSSVRAVMQSANTSEAHYKIFNDAYNILSAYFNHPITEHSDISKILHEADKHRQMRKVLRSVTESSYIDSLYPSFDIICSHGDETYPDIYIETQKGHLVFHGLMKTDVAKNGLKACINKYLKEGFQSFETKITNIFNNPQECLPPRQVYSTGTICFFNQFESYSVLLYPAHLSSESDQKTFLKDFAILADQVCKDVSENPKIEQSEEALVAMGNTHAPLLNLFKKAGKIALALQTMPSDIECFANTAADLRYCDRKEYEGAWIRTIFNNNNIKLLKNVGLPLTLCAEKLTYDALLRISVTVADRILQFGNTPVIQTILQNHHANSITAFIADDKSGIANDILSLLDVYAQATIIENKKVLNSIKKALENPKYAEPDQLQKLTNKAMLKLNVVATHNEHKQPLNDTEINRDYTTQ